jgi:primosomal protein N' (replication factor Y)
MIYLDLPDSPSVVEPLTGYAIGTKVSGWIEVLVDCPGVQELYTYHIPPTFTVQVGDIVSVPFGNQMVGGIALRSLHQLPASLSPQQIKDIEDVVASGLFQSSYWELLFRIADYYYTPLIQVIKVALPPGLLARSQRRIRLISDPDRGSVYLGHTAKQILELLQAQAEGDYSWQYLQKQVKNGYRGLRELLSYGLVESYLATGNTQRPKLQKAVTLIADILATDLTDRQREILECLTNAGGEMWQTELLKATKATTPTIKKIEEKGYIAIELKAKLRTEQIVGIWNQDDAKHLTQAQSDAVNNINSKSGFHQILLHGVTGSGKTEVYLQIIKPILAAGKSALVLVPEIGLTPQLTDRFRARFGDRICVYHSALSDGERYDTWRQMLSGTPQIIIGTRSAIFAPLPNLGILILDEEHDASFKQDQPAPTYHARIVAKWRAELESCPLILGSATPSLDTWVSIHHPSLPDASHTHYLSLPDRVQSRPLPPVEIVDMRQELKAGNRGIFSRSLHQSLHQLQANQQQGILFIHRRGYSSFVSCRSCGYVMECPHCDVSLAYHQPGTAADGLLRCHYCNFAQAQPRHCPECNSPYFKFFGSGTQKIVDELSRQFPRLRSLRFDSDTTSKKGAHREILSQFAQGEADLLVGTQMLTKGLDLPQVTLVGVVAADGLLHLSDYRAAERTFQTLTQVAGRCGRGEEAGKVIIQTYNPEHPVLQTVTKHNYPAFIAAELPERQLLDYPPYGQLILLRFSSPDGDVIEQIVTKIGEYLSEQAIEGKYEVLGPAPATVMRVSNRYRWQITIKYLPKSPVTLPDWDTLRTMCTDHVKMTIDVDPQNFL